MSLVSKSLHTISRHSTKKSHFLHQNASCCLIFPSQRHFHTSKATFAPDFENTPAELHATANREVVQEFIEPTLFAGKPMEEAGRAWDLNELRRKSFDDLHRLYYALIKERNRLHTTKIFYRFMQKHFDQNERIVNCKKSMARIKQVIQEREELARDLAWEEFSEKKARGVYKWPIDLRDEQVQNLVDKYNLWTLRKAEKQRKGAQAQETRE